MSTIEWTDAPNGSAGHVAGVLVIQLRRLGIGGWSAGWRNGMTWDVADQLTQVERQASRHFKRRDAAKRAAEAHWKTAEGAGPGAARIPPTSKGENNGT